MAVKPRPIATTAAESLVQCMSCASSFDPEPKQVATFGETGGTGGILESLTGALGAKFASADGDYVFFDTASALVPADVDGEARPQALSQPFSSSSDVYEWRKFGIDGCTHVQGCLALITNGRGGYLNLFLGTDESGRDVFFYTDSQLTPPDNDAAGDVYDARIDGGAPPVPPRPVECEGDACSTPANLPNDVTPSSFTVSGAGNVSAPASTKPAAKAKKAKPKKAKSKKKLKHPKKARTRGKKDSGQRGKTTASSRRSK